MQGCRKLIQGMLFTFFVLTQRKVLCYLLLLLKYLKMNKAVTLTFYQLYPKARWPDNLAVGKKEARITFPL